MKRPSKKRKPRPRLPLEAVLRLRSHPITTKKGEKGYERKSVKKETKKIIEE